MQRCGGRSDGDRNRKMICSLGEVGHLQHQPISNRSPQIAWGGAVDDRTGIYINWKMMCSLGEVGHLQHHPVSDRPLQIGWISLVNRRCALCSSPRRSHHKLRQTDRASQVAARRQGEARRLTGSRSTKANTPLYPAPLQLQRKIGTEITSRTSLYAV